MESTSTMRLAGVVGGHASAWPLAYLDWATDAVRALRLLVSSDDIARPILTP
jgi:hypothetical protein